MLGNKINAKWTTPKGHAGDGEKQTFKQMIAIEYTCYGGGRCSNRIKNGIAESVWMIRECFIGKVVKTSGEIRGCTGI